MNTISTERNPWERMMVASRDIIDPSGTADRIEELLKTSEAMKAYDIKITLQNEAARALVSLLRLVAELTKEFMAREAAK